jgi:RNA polymerase sigma-70 factor (ECF subfamily)
VLYLVFTEGHSATAGTDLVRTDLCAEAIRLGRVLVELMPDEPEAVGLLALMLLTEARRPARTDAQGQLVILAEQDRSLWDQTLIAEGHRLVRQCLRRGAPGPYQLQAAINAVHTDAPRAADTDWPQVVALYDQLMAIAPTPVTALNRAVAVSEVEGPARALELVDELEVKELVGYDGFHVARAELLRRLERRAESALAYEQALQLTDNEVERAHLRKRLSGLDSAT